MEIYGKIRLIGDTISVGSNGFIKRLLVVDTDEQYSQPLPIDFVKDKCSILDNYRIGESVKVGINLRGNEYNGKYYCSIQGWMIEKHNPGPTTGHTGTGSAADAYHNSPQQQNFNQEDHDDLPF